MESGHKRQGYSRAQAGGVTDSHRQSPEEKLASVESQISGLGTVNLIDCPYCGKQSVNGQVFCCETLMKAIVAIMQRQEAQDLAEQAARIRDRIGMN